MITECPWQLKPAAEEANFAPLLMGGEVLIATGEKVNQTAFGCLLRDAPSKEILNSY